MYDLQERRDREGNGENINGMRDGVKRALKEHLQLE